MLITAPRDCSKAAATGRPPKRTAKPPAQSSTGSGVLPSWHRSRCPLSRSFTVTACLSIAQSSPTHAATPSAAYHVSSGIDVLLFFLDHAASRRLCFRESLIVESWLLPDDI